MKCPNMCEVFKYGIVGVIGTVLHFFLLILFVELFRFDAVISSALGFIIVLVVSYFLNKKWTFQIKESNKYQFIKYIIVSITGLTINTLIMYFIVNVMKFYYLFGQVIVVIVVPISNYLLNKFWTFKNTK